MGSSLTFEIIHYPLQPPCNLPFFLSPLPSFDFLLPHQTLTQESVRSYALLAAVLSRGKKELIMSMQLLVFHPISFDTAFEEKGILYLLMK